jgi:hypothetical protein
MGWVTKQIFQETARSLEYFDEMKQELSAGSGGGFAAQHHLKPDPCFTRSKFF